MTRSYRKYKKIRKRRPFLKRIVKNKFFLSALLVFFVASGFFYLFFLSPVFLIYKIQIEGDFHFISKDEVKRYVEESIRFFGKRNIFAFSKGKLSNSLMEKFPPIKEVKIKRDLPHKLIIQIEERKPIGIFCQESCLFLDKEGVIFYSTETKDLVVFRSKESKKISPGEKIIEKTLLTQILNVIDALKKELEIKVKEVFIAPLEVELKTKNDTTIHFSPQKNFGDQTEDLILLIKRQIGRENFNKVEYIDLRFDKIFYKSKEK